MKINKITSKEMAQNCYVLVKEKTAILIDPGMQTDEILSFLDKNQLNATAVLLTHGHFDHIYSCKTLKDRGAKIYISEADAPKLLNNELNIGYFCGVDCQKVLPDGFLTEGKCQIENEYFEIIFTPGHTSGSVLIVYKDNVFTGDTYFTKGVYGRTDLLDGDQDKLEQSLKIVNKIIKGKKIYPGHE